jgi:hypothetical protein
MDLIPGKLRAWRHPGRESALDRCRLVNPGDRAARSRPGPRYWIADLRRSTSLEQSENKLQSPQNLPRVESRGEAERIALHEIAIPATGEPHRFGIVIRSRQHRGEGEHSGWADRDRDDFVHSGEVCAIE